jgi:hypothetical protein
MYREQLPLAGNLEQNFTLPKIVVFCRKSRGFFGALAAFVSVHAHQTLTGHQSIPAAGLSLPEVNLTGAWHVGAIRDAHNSSTGKTYPRSLSGRGFSFGGPALALLFDGHQQNINHISLVARLIEWGP